MRRSPNPGGRASPAVLVLAATALAACATTGAAGRGPPGDLSRPPEAPVLAPGSPPPPVATLGGSGGPVGPDVKKVAFTTPRGERVAVVFQKQGRSVGSATSGGLDGGLCLKPKGPGFVHLGENGCGTTEAVTLLLFAIGEVERAWPGTVPVVIGSLSKPGGGKLRPHKSHRSGRDADVGFYAAGNRAMTTFEALSADGIDFDKSFLLMATLLSSGRVTNIFVNYALQGYLYEAARAMGYDDEQLAWILQYPRGRSAKVGMIRHASGHTRHFHVRFACPAGDESCQEFTPKAAREPRGKQHGKPKPVRGKPAKG
jgi:murein endopeptidase